MQYTINFYHLPRMFQQKPKLVSHREPSELQNQAHAPARTIRFNLSQDNLRPFVHTCRTPPRQVAYRKMSAGKLRPSSKIKEIFSYTEPLRKHSPDVVRESSNTILRAIEDKGIGCVWDDVEEVRSEFPEEKVEDGEQTWREVWREPVQQRVQKNQSVASTNDQFSGYYSPMYQQGYQLFQQERRQYDFNIYVENIGNDWRTTLMIKNIPNKYTINSLAEEIDRYHSNCYDFLYLPCDIKNNCNMGYGFINFLHTDFLRNFYQNFNKKGWAKFKSTKICILTYARLQGLGSLIEHFQNSKVLNHKDKKYQPIIREFSSIDSLIQTQQSAFSSETRAGEGICRQ